MEYCSWAFCYLKALELCLLVYVFFLRVSRVCVCVCVCVCVYLFNFGCVTPDVFKGRYHAESSSLVNIRCPSVIVFRLWLQRTASMLQSFFILSSIRMASIVAQVFKLVVALEIGGIRLAKRPVISEG